MLFNSYEFLFLFLPITFLIYFFLTSKRLIILSRYFLVLSSLFFYGWWDFKYLFLILTSMGINFLFGKTFSRNKISNTFRKNLLFLGISINLGFLGYFKYSDFFISNLNNVFQSQIPLLNITLPLAISFFTFQQIAYLVDSYRNETKEYDFINYAVFVSFFPQLIAGPIVHHGEMMPQFSNLRNKLINYDNIVYGIFIFSIGLFKKVLLADKFAIWASTGFDNANYLNLIESWCTSIAYTFQLYFDFSGYTDMAIGVALLFNIRLPINFNSPYKALNIKDFWKRWHITLSRFLRDYIYIPLGGNRKGEFVTYGNLLITFLLGGIWHGAGWTFVFWGLLHGLALIIHRLWNKFNIRIYSWLSWLITFNFVNISWIFFRAKNWTDALKIFKAMFNFREINLSKLPFDNLDFLSYFSNYSESYLINIGGNSLTGFWILLGFAILLKFNNSNELLANFKLTSLSGLFIIITFIISLMKINEFSEFLYFNF